MTLKKKRLHPRKLTWISPKWWFGQDGSFWLWPCLVSTLNFWDIFHSFAKKHRDLKTSNLGKGNRCSGGNNQAFRRRKIGKWWPNENWFNKRIGYLSLPSLTYICLESRIVFPTWHILETNIESQVFRVSESNPFFHIRGWLAPKIKYSSRRGKLGWDWLPSNLVALGWCYQATESRVWYVYIYIYTLWN